MHSHILTLESNPLPLDDHLQDAAGVAHLTAIILASTRIYQLRSGALHPTYRLKGLSR